MSNSNQSPSTSKLQDVPDVLDRNGKYLIKLGPTTELNKPQITDSRKAEMRRQQVLSMPVGPTQYTAGALPLTKGLTANHMTDGKPIIKSIPVSEQSNATTEVNEKTDLLTIDELMEINGMDYGFNPEIGIVNYNRYETFTPNKATYKVVAPSIKYTPSLVVQLQIGSAQFINGKNSYMKFNLTNNDTGNLLNFGEGSSANIIKSINVKLSDGQILDRHNEFGMFSHIYDTWIKGNDYLVSIGRTKGYHLNPATDTIDTEYMIMLGDLIPLFGIDQLLPPNLTNEMTITIEFETPDKAFKEKVAGTQTPQALEYTVSDVEFVFDSYYMNHEFQKIMYEKECFIEYMTYETLTHIEDNTEYFIDLDISKSRIHEVFCRYKDYDLSPADTLRFSNVATTGVSSLSTESVYWKINNRQYPERPMTSEKEQYMQNYTALNMLNDKALKINYDQFLDTDYTHILNLSRGEYNPVGIPVDHSNIIRFNLKNQKGLSSRNFIFNFFILYKKRLSMSPIDPVTRSKRLTPTFTIEE